MGRCLPAQRPCGEVVCSALYCRAAFLLAALIGRTVVWVLLGVLFGHLKRGRFQGALRAVFSAKGQQTYSNGSGGAAELS